MCLDSDSEGCGLDRRDFLIRGAAAFAGLGALGAEGAVQEKEQPPTRVLDNSDIQHGKVIFKHAGKETFDGFLARPKADGAFPAVLVIAGNRISEEVYLQHLRRPGTGRLCWARPEYLSPLTGQCEDRRGL